MIEQTLICLGCCLDYQGVARAEDPSSHPDWELFDHLSKDSHKEVPTLRRLCLKHQEGILVAKLERSGVASNNTSIKPLLDQVRSQIKSLGDIEDHNHVG